MSVCKHYCASAFRGCREIEETPLSVHRSGVSGVRLHGLGERMLCFSRLITSVFFARHLSLIWTLVLSPLSLLALTVDYEESYLNVTIYPHSGRC
ncbi:hypothetical protein BDW71DRAFT_13199 [Aspergillus fruticulosus]